jgi:TonB-dependent siderophore receptor
MLEGTGYTYSQIAPNRLSLVEAPRGSGAAVLPTISVEGQRTTDPARTENTGSYTADVATVGGKGATAIRDIPQSVSVVTRQRMDDQNITTLDDAMKQTTGMSVTRFDGAGNFNTIQARGFDVDNVMLDGVNMSTNGNLATGLDTAMYDRIEVLRGPAGLFQGSGEPAGVINLVRKRALPDLSYGGALQVGSWEHYRAEGDVTSKLVDNGRVRGRLVALNDERDSFVDILTSHKKFFYGTVEFDLTPDTTLSIGGASQEVDSVLDQGLPAFADGTLAKIRRSTFIGARWNQLDTDTQDFFTDLEHRFDNGGTAKISLHQFDRSMLYYGYRANGAINTTTGNLNMAPTKYDLHRKDTSLDAHVSSPFEAWGLTHNITVGTDYRTLETRGLSGTGSNITTNIYNPVHDVPLVNIAYTSQTRAEQEQYGAYSQLRIKPVQWATLIGGGRFSSFNTQNHNLLTGLQTGSDAARGKLTPYGGVVFDVNEQVSLYGSYAEIFSPQTATTVGGTFVPARTGEQYEVGVKGSFAGGKANTHFALFQINDTNRAISDPNNSGFSISGGEIETRGAEAEISGSPMQGLELLAGYSYVISEFLNRAAIQATATHTPKHTLDLWAKYAFQEPLLKGWFVGAGMRAVSSYYSQSGALRFTEDGHAVFNALVGYQFTPDIAATLAVTNLLDEEYYEKVSSASRQNFYGEPRAAVLSVKAKW